MTSCLTTLGMILLMPLWGQQPGLTVEELANRAILQNGELLAMRQQIAAARGGVTQARLRANPTMDFSAMKQAGGSDNNFMIGGSLPLELFGRRERRIDVAIGAVRVNEFGVAGRQRHLPG